MTLSHTREASLTKIQRHNVHSVSVSFFFVCPPFPSHSKGIPISIQDILNPSLFFWRPRKRRLGGSGGRRGGEAAAVGGALGCFCQTDGKASLCCTRIRAHRLSLAVISRPAPTFIHSLQSGLMCQSHSTSFNKKKTKKQMLPEHSIKRHTKHYSMVMSSHPCQGRSPAPASRRTLQVRPLQLNDTEM